LGTKKDYIAIHPLNPEAAVSALWRRSGHRRSRTSDLPSGALFKRRPRLCTPRVAHEKAGRVSVRAR